MKIPEGNSFFFFFFFSGSHTCKDFYSGLKAKPWYIMYTRKFASNIIVLKSVPLVCPVSSFSLCFSRTRMNSKRVFGISVVSALSPLCFNMHEKLEIILVVYNFRKAFCSTVSCFSIFSSLAIVQFWNDYTRGMRKTHAQYSKVSNSRLYQSFIRYKEETRKRSDRKKWFWKIFYI